MKAFKPDGSRWFAPTSHEQQRRLARAADAWMAEQLVGGHGSGDALLLGMVADVPVSLDILITTATERLQQSIERMRGRAAEVDAQVAGLRFSDPRICRIQRQLWTLKAAELERAKAALQPATLNRHERRAMAKGQIPAKLRPQRGRPHNAGSVTRRVRR